MLYFSTIFSRFISSPIGHLTSHGRSSVKKQASTLNERRTNSNLARLEHLHSWNEADNERVTPARKILIRSIAEGFVNDRAMKQDIVTPLVDGLWLHRTNTINSQ